SRRRAAIEGLDDAHATAATWTWMREGRRLGGVGAGCIMCLCLGHWHSEQFAGSGDVVGTSATGEQAVVSDAMEALRQHVDEEAADEIATHIGHWIRRASLD